MKHLKKEEIQNHSQICPRGSTNTLYSNSCNSRPHEPNFTRLARKTNNSVLFPFTLFLHHISVAALRSAKCRSFHRPVLVNDFRYNSQLEDHFLKLNWNTDFTVTLIKISAWWIFVEKIYFKFFGNFPFSQKL